MTSFHSRTRTLALMALVFGAAQLAPAQVQTASAPTSHDGRADTLLMTLRARPVTVDLDRVTMPRALDLIAARSGVQIVYKQHVVESAQKLISIHAKKDALGRVLDKVLAGTNLQLVAVPETGLGIVAGSGMNAAVVEGGEIVGTVRDEGTKRPIANATISVVGTKMTARTDEKGAYRLTGLAAGKYTLTVRRLSYTVVNRVVTVQEGGTLADIMMSPAAAMLEGVVTTVTGIKKRVEIGNTIGYINADSLVKEAPITTFSELLASRIPGLTVQQGQGTVGGNVKLQIRGLNTITGNTQPIVIVDGVRYENRAAQAKGLNLIVGREPVSPLNDLNPNDIESVEVVKGPSAATLYGTDASNGVIIVTTKRGKAGPTKISVYAKRDYTTMPQLRLPQDEYYYGWGRYTFPWSGPNDTTSSCDLSTMARGDCIQDSVTHAPSLASAHPNFSPFKPAQNPEMGGSVSGGDEKIRYYLGGNYHDFTSPISVPDTILSAMRARNIKVPKSFLRPNTQSFYDLNAKFSANPNAKSDITVGGTYTRNTTNSVDVNFSPFGSFTAGRPNDPAWVDFFVRYKDPFQRTTQELAQRLNAHVNGRYQLLPWLTARASSGIDQANRNLNDVQPKDSTKFDEPNGKAEVTRTRQSGISAEGGISTDFQLGFVKLNTSIGTQYQRGVDDVVSVTGLGLPVGSTIPGFGSYVYSQQDYLENVTLGSYIEQRVAFNDRLFVSGGLRIDGATGFGDGYKTANTPKVDASWMISREPWMPHLRGLDELRLRASYGQAVKQSRATAKLPQIWLYNGSFGPQPTIEFNSYGNPLLRPERSGESDYGFDFGLFDHRLDFEYSRYHRHTTDLVVDQPIASGFGTMKRNVGLVTEDGTEINMTATAIDTRNLALSFNYNRASRGTMLVKLGDAKPLRRREGGYVEGYSLGARFQQPILGYTDLNGDGVLGADGEIIRGDSLEYVGESQAPVNQNLTINLGLLQRRLRLAAVFTRASGATELLDVNCNRCRAGYDPNTSLDGQFAHILGIYGVPAVSDYTRLSSLSASVYLPEMITRAMHGSSGAISLSVSNLKLWKKQTTSADPSSIPPDSWDGLYSGNTVGIPQSRTWNLRLGLDF